MSRILLVIFSLLFVLQLWSKTAVITEHKDRHNIESEVLFCCDTSNNKTIEDIFKSNDWQYLKGNSNFGFNDAAYWVKVDLKNQTPIDGDYVFSVPFPSINYIDFYEVANCKICKENHVGELRPFTNRQIKHRYFLFKFKLDSLQEKSFYFRIYNNGDSMHFPLELYEDNAFAEYDFLTILLSGLYIGIILFITIFNAFYNRSKKKENLFYLLYIVFTMLFLLAIEGYWAFLFKDNYLAFLDKLTIIFAILATFFYSKFTRSFLKITTHTHRITLLSIVFEWCTLLLLIPVLLDYPYLLWGIYGITAMVLAVFALNLSISILRFYENFEQARYFLVASVLATIGVALYACRDLNVIGSIPNVMKLTFLIEAVILWLAVMTRTRKEQAKAAELLGIQQFQIQKQNAELENANKELEKLSIVASETDNGIAIFSPDGELEWINLGFEKIHNTSLRRAQKEQETKITLIYESDVLSSLLEKCIASKEAVGFESAIERKEQRTIWLTTTISPYFDKNGNLQKIITIDSDITLLKQINSELNIAKEKAEESNKLKTNFLSNISHELRTPLNAIIGFSQLLLNKEYSSEKQKEFLKLINTNGSHLLELICDIIDVSRIESGSYINLPIHFNLNTMLREIHSNFEQQIKNLKQQTVRCDLSCAFSDNRALVYLDQLKLKQILINIVGNAMKFTSSGSISIGYVPMKTSQGMMLEFWVEDTGVGIPEDKLDVVFQRFRQANDNHDRPFNGAGLGLTISKGLIEIMGGSIAIQSIIDKGTRVSFLLPYSEPSIKEVPKAEAVDVFSSISLKDKKILIVEDEYSNYEVLYETLVDSGAIFLHATTGDKALKIFDNTIAAVLLDIKLPDMSGIDVAKQLIARYPDVKIIFQTAFALRETRDECMALGATDFFTKPIDPHLIIESLSSHLT